LAELFSVYSHQASSPIMIVDDVLTTGHSIMKYIPTLEQEIGRIRQWFAFVIFDRRESEVNWLPGGVPLFSMWRFGLGGAIAE
jgi:orotate phosphoribosyltransferase